MISHSVIAVAVAKRRRLPFQGSFSADSSCRYSNEQVLLQEATVILTLPFLDIKKPSAGYPATRFVLAIFGDAPAATHGGEKYFRVKRDFFRFLCHQPCALRRPRP